MKTKTSLATARPWALAVGLASLALLAPGAGSDKTKFVRGDADANGVVQITDAIRILNFLFAGTSEAPPCLKAADADDNGQLQITDAIRILGFLFLGMEPPAPPSPTSSLAYDPSLCGPDPTEDGLTCLSFPKCPQPPIPVAALAATSPQNGEENVSLTRGIVLDFSKPIVPGTVTGGSVSVQFGGVAVQCEGRPLRETRHSSALSCSRGKGPESAVLYADSEVNPASKETYMAAFAFFGRESD